ncbi:kinase-like domain-containing protein [Lanmaoa asiatica]|nr:kinase-like domain-containing protein [Lanmaoa asiatica]
MASDTHLQVDLIDPPDLTDTLQQDSKRIIGRGSFGIVYHCLCTQNGEVVKVITLLQVPGLNQTEQDEFKRKMKRELGIWRRLDHPNIVPLLGTARGKAFGSDHPCLVAMLMPHGALIDYVHQAIPILSLSRRIQLIKGTVAGLEYLHLNHIVHGDFHPGNILIDGEHNARLTDFGLSQTVSPRQGQLSYLWTPSIRPGAWMCAAPERLYPRLYPDLKVEATPHSDIYSLGCVILFILSSKFPWLDRRDAENKLGEFQNPLRPVWPVSIPNGVWNFIERCWSPQLPRNRPSAQEVLSFSRDKLEQLLQPNPINVVLFGALGCGKNSIINLLTEEPIAHVSVDVDFCTKRPRWYQTSIGERRFRLWDTMGFPLAHGEDSSPLSPYEQAHAVLRNLPDGVNLILLCARRDGIFPSLGNLYWLINDFFYDGRAPIAFVVTHCDTPDEGWWEHNQDTISQTIGIPVQSIPHACVTTVQTGRDQSKQALKTLLKTHATATAPITPRPDLSSRTTASFDLTAHCGVSCDEATELVEKFGRPLRPFNVVFFGETGAGMSSVINLIAGHPVAEVSSCEKTCTSESCSYRINTGMQQFLIWDTMGLNGMHIGHDALKNAARLIRDLSVAGGVDLLVFCKKCGKLTASELEGYGFFEEFLCEGQVPVALVVTHLESLNPMEKWWDTKGDAFVKAIGGNVIGHACITSLASDDPDDVKHHRKLLESRLSVQTMLEDCVSSRSTLARVGGTSVKPTLKRIRETGSAPKKITVKNLMDRCRLTEEQAEELIMLRYGSG